MPTQDQDTSELLPVYQLDSTTALPEISGDSFTENSVTIDMVLFADSTPEVLAGEQLTLTLHMEGVSQRLEQEPMQVNAIYLNVRIPEAVDLSQADLLKQLGKMLGGPVKLSLKASDLDGRIFTSG